MNTDFQALCWEILQHIPAFQHSNWGEAPNLFIRPIRVYPCPNKKSKEWGTANAAIPHCRFSSILN